MWLSIPQLLGQPVLELVPDPEPAPTIARFYGYSSPTFGGVGGPAGEGVYSYTGTMRTRWPWTVGACHLMIVPPSNSTVRLCLGDRYSLLVRDSAFVGLNGDTDVKGTATGSFRYLEVALQDADEDMAVAALPRSWVTASVINVGVEGLCIGCGYVLEQDGSAFMYGFANDVRITQGQNIDGTTTRNFHASTFGGQTCSLRANVDPAEVAESNMLSIAGTGGSGNAVVFGSGAAKIGPFTRHEIYRPDSAAARRARQGTMTGSLRSRALNFSVPVGSIGSIGTPSMLPSSDWAGYQSRLGGELFWPSTFLCALAGQPNSEVAFVRPDVPWNSDVGEIHEENETLARLRITLKAGYSQFSPNTSAAYTFPEITWDATTAGGGNNQYVALQSESVEATRQFGPSKTFVRQNVLASIRRSEDFNNLLSATLDGVELVDTYAVRVMVFLRDGSPDFPALEASVVWRVENIKTLSAGEVLTLLSGGVVDLGDITVEGIGPA